LFYSYVSRHSPNDTSRHVILGTQQFKPKMFAQQIALDMDNCWGILRVIIDTCLTLPEGKYLLLKDPNKVGILFFWYGVIVTLSIIFNYTELFFQLHYGFLFASHLGCCSFIRYS